MNRGDEIKFNLLFSGKYDKEFPEPFQTLLKTKNYLTPVQYKNFLELNYHLLIGYNDRRFPITCDLLDKPFFYTPDFVLVNFETGKTLWVEIKNNTGFIGSAYKTPNLWNFKKKLIMGWCKLIEIEFIELRWNSSFKTWDDFTLSYSIAINRKLPGKVKSPIKNMMVNQYERICSAYDLKEMVPYVFNYR